MRRVVLAWLLWEFTTGPSPSVDLPPHCAIRDLMSIGVPVPPAVGAPAARFRRPRPAARVETMVFLFTLRGSFLERPLTGYLLRT